MSVRTEFEALLKADWAGIPDLAGVRVVATERDLDDIQDFTALIRARTLARFPEAPQNTRLVGLLLTLISPHLDMDRAQDDLDVRADAVFDYLGTRYRHGEATQTGWGDARLAYDIPVSIIAPKE